MPITTKSPCLYYNSNRLAHKWLVLCFFPRKITPALPPIFSIGSVVDFYLVIFNQRNCHHHRPDFFPQRFFRSSPTIPIHLPIVSNFCFPIFLFKRNRLLFRPRLHLYATQATPLKATSVWQNFCQFSQTKRNPTLQLSENLRKFAADFLLSTSKLHISYQQN